MPTKTDTNSPCDPNRLIAPREVRAEFARRGVSIAEWARANGYCERLVYRVLHAERLPVRGRSHDIAVHLGIKRGAMRPRSAADLCPRPAEPSLEGGEMF